MTVIYFENIVLYIIQYILCIYPLYRQFEMDYLK